MAKPEKDEFMMGLQKDIEALGLKCQYTRQSLYVYGQSERYVHQLRVTGLVCRCMYVTLDPEEKKIHLSDQMDWQYKGKAKDWQFVLVDPATNPQIIINLFKDLKAVGDKYGRSS